jgi:hypothetical protein
MSGNILVGQLTGEALCKSGYDCGICFRCELCGIEDESKDVLSINFAVASILQPGETRTFGSHILHLFTAWSWTGGFYLFEQLSTQPRLRNREISTSKLSKHKHRHPAYSKAMKLAAGRPYKLWQMYSACLLSLSYPWPINWNSQAWCSHFLFLNGVMTSTVFYWISVP